MNSHVRIGTLERLSRPSRTAERANTGEAIELESSGEM